MRKIILIVILALIIIPLFPNSSQSYHNDLISLKKILVGEWILYDYVKEFNKTKSAGMSFKKGKYLYIFDNPESDRYHSGEKGKLLYKLKIIE